MTRLSLPRLVLALALGFSAGCGRLATFESNPPAPIISTSLSPEPGSPEGPVSTAAPIPTWNTSQDFPNSQYSLIVDLDLDTQQIAVDLMIDYINASGVDLSELLLVIDALSRGADFQVDLIAWGNGQNIQNYTFEAGLLRIPLPSALETGEGVSITLKYSLGLPAGVGQLAYTARQSNFVDWYPFVPPYREGVGWLVHPRAAVGEHLVFDSVDFDVSIRVIGQGKVQIAAPALAEPIEGGWRYRLQDARRFAWSASRHYETLRQTVNGIPVTAYVYAEHQLAGRAALDACAQAIELYGSLYGAYPYESLAIVAGEFPDGLESDGLFFLYRGFFEGYTGGSQNYLSALSAHEVAHNWFYGLVGNDPAEEPWLDEALAIYSELLYYEKISPRLVNWWWRFRIHDYAPSGKVDSTIYEHGDFATYVHAVYMRGALFLQELREIMGDEAFFDFLRAYIEAGRGHIFTGQDFFGLLMKSGDYELSRVLEDYFRP